MRDYRGEIDSIITALKLAYKDNMLLVTMLGILESTIYAERDMIKERYESKEYSSIKDCIDDQLEKAVEEGRIVGKY